MERKRKRTNNGWRRKTREEEEEKEEIQILERSNLLPVGYIAYIKK